MDTGAIFGGSQGTRAGQDTSLAQVPIGFGETGETRFTPSSITQNSDILLSQVEYRFPVGDRLKVYLIAATTDPFYLTDTVSPLLILLLVLYLTLVKSIPYISR